MAAKKDTSASEPEKKVVKKAARKKTATKKAVKKATKKKVAKKAPSKKKVVKKRATRKAIPADQKIAKEVRLNVERVYTSMGEETSKEVDEKTMDVRVFVTEPAVVSLKYGLTLNFGNYEGCRLDVGISIPCYAEERDAAYQEASRWVAERIESERDEIRQHKQALFTV